MDRDTVASEFCEGLFESEEEKLIIRRLLEGVEDEEIIRELLLEKPKAKEKKK